MEKINSSKNFCFCTLALGRKYRLMAQDLAKDLEKHSPGTLLVIGTDNPKDFKDCKNVFAFEQYQKGILHCFNDKRFVLEQALLKFRTVIYIDSDTNIIGDIHDNLEFSPGIVAPYEDLLTHLGKYRQQDLELINKLARKLDISLENVDWIGESLYIVTKDEGKEQEFIKMWGLIANYAELKGMYSGEGNLMGLAAAKVGWTIEKTDSWRFLKQVTHHFDASYQKKDLSFLENLKRRISYHYRLNKARIAALKDFDFYYR